MAGVLIECEQLRAANAALQAQVEGLLQVVDMLKAQPDNLA
jgi:hypothetical protein